MFRKAGKNSAIIAIYLISFDAITYTIKKIGDETA
jgi:hypothetical protein